MEIGASITAVETASDLLKYVQQVKLDAEGRFKYIVITAEIEGSATTTMFIRGAKNLSFHADNFEAFEKELHSSELPIAKLSSDVGHGVLTCTLKEGKKVVFRCPGGGRVEISTSKQTFHLLGYSQSYGRGDHAAAIEVAKQHFPFPHEKFTWTNEGY